MYLENNIVFVVLLLYNTLMVLKVTQGVIEVQNFRFNSRFYKSISHLCLGIIAFCF